MSMEKIKGKWSLFWIAIIIVLTVVVKLYSLHWPETKIAINGHNFHVLVANNSKHWQKGLGGRDDLGKYDGMLFFFNDTSQHAIVMRDMRFPIDIVWLKKGAIVDIAPNIAIEPGRTEEQYTIYMARDVSSMVLELPAGDAQKYGLKIGDRLTPNVNTTGDHTIIGGIFAQ